MSQLKPTAVNSHPCFGRGSTETGTIGILITVKLLSHPCFGRGSTETGISGSEIFFGRARTPASAGVPLRLYTHKMYYWPHCSHPCFGRGSTETCPGSLQCRNTYSPRTPASAGVPLRLRSNNRQSRLSRPRTPASAGVPLRLDPGLYRLGCSLLAPLLRQGFH